MSDLNDPRKEDKTEDLRAAAVPAPDDVDRTQVLKTAVNDFKTEKKTSRNETFFERTIVQGLRSTRLKLQVPKEIESDAVEEKKGGEFRNFRRIFNTVFSRVNSLMVKRSNVDEALLGGQVDRTELHVDRDPGGSQAESPESFGDLTENYTVTGKFAEGGQAVISLAEDRQIGRIVCIKTLRRELLDNPEARNHFISEARISGQLEHPSIIPVYRLCSDDRKNLHMAMKLIKGQTLQHYLGNLVGYYSRKGMNYFDEQRSLGQRLGIFLDVCDALDYAHSRGIIHCDLKPENVMIGAYHDTYLVDWGIAHPFEKDDGRPLEEKERTDRINGTPRYLSPEAAMGYPCDQRSDVFSMGVILFEIVTLRSAFIGDDATQIIKNVARGKMEKVRHRFRAAIDRDLQAIIRKATAVRREDRYQTIRDLSEDLRRYLARVEVSARPDNLPRRVLRWFRLHRTAALLTAAAITIGWLLQIAYTLYDNYRDEQRERARGMVAAKVYANAMKGLSAMQEEITLLEFCAFDAAKISGMVLHNPPPDKLSLQGLPYRCSVLKEKGAVPGAKAYGKQGVVDFGSLCFSAPVSLPTEEIELYRRKFQLLAPHFRQVYQQCSADADWDQAQNAPPAAMYDMAFDVCWLYVGLQNGMYFSYPASTHYDGNYDPRKRIWYRNSEKDVERTVWSNPYIGYAVQKMVLLTISKAITDPETGQFYGVAGVDFPLDAIRRILIGENDRMAYYCEKYLIDQDGFVLIDSRKPDQEYKEDPNTGKLDLPFFDAPDVWEKIRKQETGVLFLGKNGETVYLFSQVPYNNWYFVIRLDYEKFGQLDREQQNKLLE